MPIEKKTSIINISKCVIVESILEYDGQKRNTMFRAETSSATVTVKNAKNTSSSLVVLYSRYVIAPITERKEPKIIPAMWIPV